MKRKTSITKIASILTVLAMVWGGVACQQPTEPVEPTKYTISFDSGVESITVEEGAVATEPTTAPEKTGYKFGGWLNGEAAYDWTQPVTSNLSLTAKWTVVDYTITYLPEGVETDNPATYTIETETFELKAPTKVPDATKPNFVAWHKGEKPAEGEWAVVDSIEKGTTGDLTIVAEFSEKPIYVVTYYIGETKKTQNVEEGKSFSLTGYDLFTDKEFKTAYTAKEVTANIELYAKAKKMTVKFDSDGGSAVADAEVDYNTAVAKPTDPKKAENTFQGWTLDGKAYDFNSKVIKNITLKATWKANATEEPTIPPAGEEEPEVTYDEVTVDGNVTTILRPTMEYAWDATVKGNVISFSGNSAAKWTYENIKEYSIVELFYETTKTENAKLTIKSSDGNESHTDLGYPDLSASGSLKYNIADFVTKNTNFSHIVLANNANNNDWSDEGKNIKWDDDWSVTITKIVLTKVEKLENKVIFDPASFTAPAGMEIVEKNGVKYLKVTPNGYGTSIDLAAPVDISGYTHYTYDFYNDEAADNWQVVIGLRNYSEGVAKDDQAVGSGTDVSSTEVKTVTSALIKDSTVTALQPFTQSKTDWKALTDKVVYIGKITAITK